MSGGQWWPYNTDQWREVRDVVRVRDGHECVCCGAWRMLDVHHVQPWRCDGEVFDPRNLVTVCRDCHEAVHAELGRIGYQRRRDWRACRDALEGVRRADRRRESLPIGRPLPTVPPAVPRRPVPVTRGRREEPAGIGLGGGCAWAFVYGLLAAFAVMMALLMQ